MQLKEDWKKGEIFFFGGGGGIFNFSGTEGEYSGHRKRNLGRLRET